MRRRKPMCPRCSRGNAHSRATTNRPGLTDLRCIATAARRERMKKDQPTRLTKTKSDRDLPPMQRPRSPHIIDPPLWVTDRLSTWREMSDETLVDGPEW